PPFGRFLPRLGLAGRRRRGLFIKCIVSRAQRSISRAFTPVLAGYGGALQTRSRVYPRSALKVRKSGKPDLRGPLRTELLAVPDQRCTACALHRIRDTEAIR